MVFVPLFFCPLVLKKGAELRKIPSEVVKKVSDLVKISSEEIRNCSDVRATTSVKKLFCSRNVKTFRHLNSLKMKRILRSTEVGTINAGKKESLSP